MHLLRWFPVLLIGLLVLAACAGQPAAEPMSAAPAAAMEESAAAEPATDETMAEDAMQPAEAEAEEAHGDTMESETMAGDEAAADAGDQGAMEQPQEQAVESEMAEEAPAASEEMADAGERPAWQDIALVNARTGEQFTLAGYASKTVFVEPFATWCGNCRRQLGNVQQAYASAGDDVVFVALSVEPNIANEALVEYADKEGFEYIFAAMPPDMLQELAALYGQTIANPPATPHFIIRPDGTTTDLVTGIEGPDAVLQQIQAAAG